MQEEHRIGLLQMFLRHLGPKNTLYLVRHVMAPQPAQFMKYFFEGKELFPEGYTHSGREFPHGVYFIGLNPGSSVDSYVRDAHDRLAEDVNSLGVVAATCTQHCLSSRNEYFGGHHPPVIGSGECRQEVCSFNSLSEIVDEYNGNYGAELSVHPLSRTSRMVKEVMVPNLYNKVNGHHSYNMFLFNVCSWAVKEVPFAGAYAVARSLDWLIMVSVLEGKTCNPEQFIRIDDTGIVDPEVLTHIPEEGYGVARTLLC